MPLALVGGTGLDTLPGDWQPLTADTPFGSVNAFSGLLGGRDTIFLPRHGPEHALPPHRINYRANALALQLLGCDRVLALTAVGGIDPALAPGTLCLPTQFLDFTVSRDRTLFEPPEYAPVHMDLTEPYCPELRQSLQAAAAQLSLPPLPEVVYVCTEGPRFETPAEIRMFAQLGGQVVGMTGGPEVGFAREAGLCYAGLSVVTNFAAGLRPQPLTVTEMTDLMDGLRGSLLELLATTAGSLADPNPCTCGKPA
ncbi:MAG: MTAP family purine nucleoside phosphorylase [candidate division WS1 bacterium]|nr:MTAP family purine nucleoside phosphorylase [candidate division WS1 bacterium]